MFQSNIFDAIVIGAGHAGVEASLSIARSGFRVLLLTMSTNSVSQMSCNPAIGGLAKGHMVREIDALGGEMALAIDQTAIQFRMLNRSKGPAVWAPRAQADKKAYQGYMKRIVESEPNILLVEDQAIKLITQNAKAAGVETKSGAVYHGQHVVITTGTFMKGLIHIGNVHFPGGRGGDPPSVGLSDSLKAFGIEVKRFKTGTPPRIRKSTINFEACEIQPGDSEPQPFSYRTRSLACEQLPCHLTYTNEKTHEIIRRNLHRSPLYAGVIQGIGPRYCPSIEDKVVKFKDKLRHQIYLEPEGRETDEYYINGISTSLPQDVQIELVRTIPGLEKAELMRFGYAIEYDCIPPTQLNHSLETKAVKNLFLAGQINCTSGYEEAAAQGLMAGLNVVRKLRGEEPFILSRSEAYIGVLIDDLVTRGTNEPYRMFTSRAEFRLLLRQDNADERLMTYGREFGLIDEKTFSERMKISQACKETIQKLRISRVGVITAEQWLKRPENNIKSLKLNELQEYIKLDEVSIRVENEVKYAGYIDRQLMDVGKFKKMERRKIPSGILYENVRGISREAKEKFERIKPESIGQASRIPGISPCDVTVLSIYVEKYAKI